jgi:hypothetical protein
MLTRRPRSRILADWTAQEKSARAQVQQPEKNPSAASQGAVLSVREVAENKGFSCVKLLCAEA